MYAIVAGGGKVGANVARSLLKMGHEVTLIEQRPYRFEQLQDEFEHQVLLGDATELHVLELSVLDAVSVSASMLSNVGPAFGIGGPLGSFEPFSDFSTVVMTGLMWLGRLQIVPIVVLLSRHYWRNV